MDLEIIISDATGAPVLTDERACNMELHVTQRIIEMANQNVIDTNPPGGDGASPGPSSPAAVTPSSQMLLYREAYQQALAASAELRDSELLPVNLDVPSAVATAVGSLPRIMAFRADAEKLLRFDVSHFDKLQTFTFAVGHAHAKFLAAWAAPEALLALNERATKLRDTMYSDASALANRGIIAGDRISGFKANVGYKNIAFDLLGLATLLRENWDKISSRTAVLLSELDDAELLGRQLMDAVGAREQAPALVAQVQEQRQRNFTLFSRSYDQVRRALTYLRWDDEDLEHICPSLYAGRGGRRKEAPEPVVPATNASTTAVDPVTPAAAASGAAIPGAAPSTTVITAPAAPGVGLPNGNPFAPAG